MSISSIRTNLTRIQSSIADLAKKDAVLAKKEANLSTKFNKASESATKARTASSLSTKLREAQRTQSSLAKVQKDRADIANKIVNKRKDENRYQDLLLKEEVKQRKKEEVAIATFQKNQKRRQLQLAMKMKNTVQDSEINSAHINQEKLESIEYDVFISHASEDKASFVEALAVELQSRGLRVWYDNFTLKWGDKLRQEIDKGLRSSRFGIVVLSKSFFEKNWPQDELDGLYQMEIANGIRILPIWHNITKDEIQNRSPMMVSRLGLNTATSSINEIADQLEDLIKSIKP